MARRYVSVDKAKIRLDDGTSMQLIYGDEIDTIGSVDAETCPSGTVGGPAPCPLLRSTPSRGWSAISSMSAR